MIRTIIVSTIALTLMGPGFAAEPAQSNRMFLALKVDS